eukprot:scaffold182240_cov33-Tisochrysis_lutea.AAC.1
MGGGVVHDCCTSVVGTLYIAFLATFVSSGYTYMLASMGARCYLVRLRGPRQLAGWTLDEAAAGSFGFWTAKTRSLVHSF